MKEAFALPVPEKYIYIDTFFQHRERDLATLKLIEEWKEEARRQRDREALILLDVRKAYVLQNTGTPPGELLVMVDSLLAVSTITNDSYLLASIHMQRGWFYEAEKRYPQAFESYLEVNEHLRDFTQAQFPNKNYFLYSIANVFYQFYDYEMVIEIGSRISRDPLPGWIETFNTNQLGMSYLHLAKYDSARYWFQACLETLRNTDDVSNGWRGVLNGNIGKTWYLEHNEEKAIPLFEDGLQKTGVAKLWDNQAVSAINLGLIWLRRGEIDKAKEYLDIAEAATYQSSDEINYQNYHDAISQYYRKTGNTALALFHLDSMVYYKTKIEASHDTRMKIQVEYKFQNERHLAETQLLKAETNRQKLIRNLVIGMLFLLMIVGLLYINRQRLKSAFKEQQLLQQKQKAEEELATAQTQLDDFTRSMVEKNALIEKFGDEIQKLQALPCNIITPEQTEALNQLRLSAILTDEDWEEFRARFEKVHAGFLQRLRMKIPDLSPAETRFMALAKLQLNNKEMGSILGISPDSIRTIRYRLRKKLKLSEEGGMEELVSSV